MAAGIFSEYLFLLLLLAGAAFRPERTASRMRNHLASLFTEFFLDCTGFLPSFAALSNDLPAFTEFYWVFPSFTGFYRVLLGLT